MKVRITEKSDSNVWYNSHIGEVFEVEESGHHNYFQCKENQFSICKENCTVIPELSNAEQAEIIRKVKDVIDNKNVSGLCVAVRYVTNDKYELKDIHALMKYKPTDTHYDGYWFAPHDKAPRLAICDKALADLEDDDIKVFAEAHPEAKEALAKLYPDKFEEDKSVDLSELRDEDCGFITNFSLLRDYLWVSQSDMKDKIFALSSDYDWELQKETDINIAFLIPTKK